jgi:hypothetical protein
MTTLVLRAFVGVCLMVPAFSYAGQPDHAVIYPRLICIVPMIGAGTMQDPYRPLFAPNPQSRSGDPASRDEASEIIAFQSLPTDDGKAAIVIFVARSYAALAPLLQDSRIIRHFEQDRWNIDDLTRELQKYKKNFEPKMLRVGAL